MIMSPFLRVPVLHTFCTPPWSGESMPGLLLFGRPWPRDVAPLPRPRPRPTWPAEDRGRRGPPAVVICGNG